jgi:hypothetical protein
MDQQEEDVFAEVRAATKEHSTFSVVIVPAHQFDSMMDAADKGNEAARRCVTAFFSWQERIAAEAERGNLPACFQCQQPVVRIDDGGDGIGGIAVIASIDLQAIGMVAVFCPACAHLGRDGLLPQLYQTMETEAGLAVSKTHELH